MWYYVVENIFCDTTLFCPGRNILIDKHEFYCYGESYQFDYCFILTFLCKETLNYVSNTFGYFFLWHLAVTIFFKKLFLFSSLFHSLNRCVSELVYRSPLTRFLILMNQKNKDWPFYSFFYLNIPKFYFWHLIPMLLLLFSYVWLTFSLKK